MVLENANKILTVCRIYICGVVLEHSKIGVTMFIMPQVSLINVTMGLERLHLAFAS